MGEVECKKVKYSNKEFCENDLKKIRSKSDREKVPIRAYLCKCGAWHLTSKKDKNLELNKLKKEVDDLKAIINNLNKSVSKKTKEIRDNRETIRGLILKLNHGK